MIFAACQILEKVREHQESLFVPFIDLKKVYDSVPTTATWSVLAKYGAPPNQSVSQWDARCILIWLYNY